MIIPTPLPNTGFAAPLRAAFLVFRRWPLIGVASNNLNPSLTLQRDFMEYNLLKPKRRGYAEIEMIDARQWLGGHDMVIHWRGGFFATRMNLARPELLAELLKFFANRGCNLTKGARQLVVAGADSGSINNPEGAKELSHG